MGAIERKFSLARCRFTLEERAGGIAANVALRINAPPPQPSLPAATPSSSSSFDLDLSDVPTAEDKSAKSDGVNKSAKVVLGRVLINRD
jgi:hypothetical protein